MQSFFTVLDAPVDGGFSDAARPDRYLADGHTAGPWSADLQHGGPPSALLVRTAERSLAAQTGRTDLVPRRSAFEFLGPVPVGEVDVSARVLRVARSAALVEAVLQAAGRECLHARVWFVAALPGLLPAPHGEPPGAPESVARSTAWRFPYAEQIEWRPVAGSLDGPGPATVWVRALRTLVPGEAMSALQRTVLVADSASGVSAELDWNDWSFVNVDLDIHLAGEPADEWTLMDTATMLGSDGTGVASSRLSDRRGPIGGGLQTLVVRPTRR